MQAHWENDQFFNSHNLLNCPQGTFCHKWAGPEHLASYQHQWSTPCEEPAFCSRKADEGRCLIRSHPCDLGSQRKAYQRLIRKKGGAESFGMFCCPSILTPRNRSSQPAPPKPPVQMRLSWRALFTNSSSCWLIFVA